MHLLCFTYSLSRHPSVAQCKQGGDFGNVLRQAAVSRRCMAELALRDSKQMLGPGMDAGFRALDLVGHRIQAVAGDQLPAPAGPHRDVPAQQAAFAALLDARTSGIGVHGRLFAMHWRLGYVDVVNVGCAISVAGAFALGNLLTSTKRSTTRLLRDLLKHLAAHSAAFMKQPLRGRTRKSALRSRPDRLRPSARHPSFRCRREPLRPPCSR